MLEQEGTRKKKTECVSVLFFDVFLIKILFWEHPMIGSY